MTSQTSLRAFLSDAHQRAFSPEGILDRQVEDPLLEERLHRFHTQITAAYALRDALSELSIPVHGNSLDLVPLIETAWQHGLIDPKEKAILLNINKFANEAKHQLHFASRQ